MAELSVREVAKRLATSDRTVRRYLASGQLAGSRTADGWTVSADDLDQFLATRTDTPSSNGHHADNGVAELVHLVDRLQRENRDLAGMVGSLQQRLIFAEDRIHALEAPKQTNPAEIAPQRPSANGTTETSQRPPEQRNSRPRAWWRWW